MRQVPDYPLWLGHTGDLRDLRGIHAASIRAVVDLAWNEPPAMLSRDLVYCRFPIVDGGGNPPWLLRAAVETVAGLLRDQTATLICCGAGMSRSPCIAAAAIARIRGCTAAEALAMVIRLAPGDVSPGLWAEVHEILVIPGSRPRRNSLGAGPAIEDADQRHCDMAAEADVDIVAPPPCS